MVKLINDAKFILFMKHTLKITLFLVFIFLAAQIIGLAVTYAYIDKEKTAETGELVFEDLPLGMERPEVEKGSSLLILVVGAILVGTIILLLLIRFNVGILWKIWFFLAIWLTLTVAFGAFIPVLAAGVLGFLLAGWKVLRPNIFIQNITELFVYGGLAAIFVPIKSFTISIAIILLILISIYDMYAVWKSKHMVKLAKYQSKQKVFAGLLVPYKLPKGMKKIKKRGKGKLIKVKTAVLGGGDIGFPLIFAGVVMKQFGFLKTLVIPVAVTIALFLLLYYSKKDKFYPAMPFISAGCLAGYVLVLLL